MSKTTRSFKGFLSRKVAEVAKLHIVGFDEPVEVKPLSPKRVDVLSKAHVDKNGELDRVAFQKAATIDAIVFPPIKSKDFQDEVAAAYNVEIIEPWDVMDTLFSNYDYQRIAEAALGEQENINDLIDEAKN